MEPEPTAESLLKGPHQELNAYIEHLLYLLREKDLILLNKNVEIESLKTLLSFYRDQFDLDSYSQTLKELEDIKFQLKARNLELEAKESIVLELKTNFKDEEDSYQTKLKELNIEKTEVIAQKNDVFKLLEDANRQNKRYGQEIKLLKTQLSSLQQKNSMGQQLIDSLKKELFSLRDEKSKLQDELQTHKENPEKRKISFWNSSSLQAPKEDLFLEEELDKLQRDLDSLEALNGNIQSSLQQFQITHQNSRNTIGSRSIDMTKTFLSPKSASFLIKNPSISLIQHQQQPSIGLQESQKDIVMVSKFEIPEKKSEENFRKRSKSSNKNLFETINEAEKDQEIETENQKKAILTSIKRSETHKKSKSISFVREFESQSVHRGSKSLAIVDPILEAKQNLKLVLQENDCFQLMRLLIEANANLFKDLDNKFSSHSNLIAGHLAELPENAEEPICSLINKERFLHSQVFDFYKEYQGTANEMLRILNEQTSLIQKIQQLCESQETALHNNEIELKCKLEEIVKLTQNIIDMNKKEINFEENINEIYGKYMQVLENENEQEDLEKWKKLDRFKKFTKTIEGWVQEKLQIKGLSRDIEGLNKEIDDLKQQVANSQEENHRKNEATKRGENREKSLKKDREFFYSQLMFFKKKVLENDLIGGDRDSVFGILAQLKLDEKNLEEIQGFIGKYKNLEGSIKTLVGNLNSYEDNKVKEKSTMP